MADTTPIDAWADRLEAAIARTPACCVDRVAVVRETASTQDAALRLAGAKPGLLVVAGRQTGGRGRHGRVWVDTGEQGLAATFAIADDGRDPADLSAVGGLGARDAIAAVAPGVALRLKRPNDVLAVGADDEARKVAGVLIERRGGLVLIGIGINIAQRAWPEDLAGRAVSLAELGAGVDRVEVACALVGALSAALAFEAGEVERRWG